MSIVIAFLIRDYTGCVGDAVTGRWLYVLFIFFETEYRSCRGSYWRHSWKRLVWQTVRPHPEKLVPSSPSTTSSMYLLVFIFCPYFLGLLTVKAAVKSVIYNEVAGAELRSTVSFGPFSLPPSLMSLRYNDLGQPRPLLLSIHAPRWPTTSNESFR